METSRLNGSTAEFKVSICPEDAPVEARIKFSNLSEEISVAAIEFYDTRDASSHSCYANTRKTIVLDLKSFVAEEMKRQNINSLGANVRSLPLNLEVINAR